MAAGGDDGVDEKKRPATVLTETDGVRINEETVSMDMETDGDDVDEHANPCICDWVWPLEEAAPIDLEAPLEERLETLLYDIDEPLLISKGNRVYLEELLFTPERDYLMKSNGQKVYSSELLGKYVVLFIFPLLNDDDEEDNEIIRVTKELVELRNLLWHTNRFEIVSVALSHTDHSNQQRRFESYSARMTWPFIPFCDHYARERVIPTFGFPMRFVTHMNCHLPYLGIVDPSGKLLQSWAWNMLNYYLDDAFPFTDEHIISLYEHEALMFSEGVSLKALLGTSTRDYVLAPNGEKVLIQDLEDKVVCIILDMTRAGFIEKVLEGLKSEGLPDNFVPVYVARHFTHTTRRLVRIDYSDYAAEICESAGWLRIPYGDTAARKIYRVILRRRAKGGYAKMCNVVGPYGSYVDSYALASMVDFGIWGYPFTVGRRAELVAQSLEFNFPYEQFLEPACHVNSIGQFEVVLHPDCRISCSDEQKVVQKHVLCNKRLLILFGTHWCCELGLFLCELKSLYKKKKGTDEEFEVIYISLDCLQSDFDDSTSRMPWFAFPLKIKDKEKALRFLKYDEVPWCGDIPAIVAFERDGRYVGTEGDLHLKKDRRTDFPYVNSVADDYMKKIEFAYPAKPNYEFWRRF